MSFIFVKKDNSMAKTQIHIKRVYEDAKKEDGYRVLVDRLWPRGITKERLAADLWAKSLAPSDGLRKWYDHNPERWEEFWHLYEQELSQNQSVIEFVQTHSHLPVITLLYAAKDQAHTHALVLQSFLRRWFS